MKERKAEAPKLPTKIPTPGELSARILERAKAEDRVEALRAQVVKAMDKGHCTTRAEPPWTEDEVALAATGLTQEMSRSGWHLEWLRRGRAVEMRWGEKAGEPSAVDYPA